MELKFRKLKAEEIDCRVASQTDKGVTYLLYKDARVDMNILDETVGPENWQRDHKELKGNIYCGIAIWDDKKNQWITKWDCGKESFSEAEKGEASDSFKRAGFNWGIGRELYTAPFIWISIEKLEVNDRNGKKYIKDNIKVSKIKYDNDNNIIELELTSNLHGVVYTWSNGKTEPVEPKEETKAEPKKITLSTLTVEEYNALSEDNKNKIKDLIAKKKSLPFASDTDVIEYLKNK